MRTMSETQLRVGARVGGGPEPGYEWDVWYLVRADREARQVLQNLHRYEHMKDQFRDLAGHASPSRSDTLEIDAIGDFFELKDKGGVLFPLNIRAFFGVDGSRKAIIVLGLIHKQNNGPTPIGDRKLMERRWRAYKAGRLGYPN